METLQEMELAQMGPADSEEQHPSGLGSNIVQAMGKTI